MLLVDLKCINPSCVCLPKLISIQQNNIFLQLEGNLFSITILDFYMYL